MWRVSFNNREADLTVIIPVKGRTATEAFSKAKRKLDALKRSGDIPEGGWLLPPGGIQKSAGPGVLLTEDREVQIIEGIMMPVAR